MRLERFSRVFGVGRRGGTLTHVADLHLDPDEVVTFRSGRSEVDVTRKEWGYYLSPSMNQRLAEHGLRAALCVGVPREDGGPPRMYLMAVEDGGEAAFDAYAEAEEMRVVAWLDTDEAVERAAKALSIEFGGS